MNKSIKNLISWVIGPEAIALASRWLRYKRRARRDARFARYGMDRRLEEVLPHKGGFYVELGANDGALASNSYYFELKKNWTGILIEPCPNLYLSCLKLRGIRNKVFCNACVPFDFSGEFVAMTYSDSMTISNSLDLDIGDRAEFIVKGDKFLAPGEHAFEFGAKAATLNQLLIDGSAPRLIDFLSLDVEGAELDVLRGVDFAHFNFRYIIVECRNLDRLSRFLHDHGYTLLDKLSHHDYLFKFRD